MSITALLFAAALLSDSAPMVGNDADKHGCLGSAGYTWSPLRSDCIRLFESGIRMDPVSPDGSATISAFIVFKGDRWTGPLELYLPGAKTPLLLKQKRNQWTGHGWSVRKRKGVWEASRGGAVAFRSTEG